MFYFFWGGKPERKSYLVEVGFWGGGGVSQSFKQTEGILMSFESKKETEKGWEA